MGDDHHVAPVEHRRDRTDRPQCPGRELGDALAELWTDRRIAPQPVDRRRDGPAPPRLVEVPPLQDAEVLLAQRPLVLDAEPGALRDLRGGVDRAT